MARETTQDGFRGEPSRMNLAGLERRSDGFIVPGNTYLVVEDEGGESFLYSPPITIWGYPVVETSNARLRVEATPEGLLMVAGKRVIGTAFVPPVGEMTAIHSPREGLIPEKYR